MNQETTVQSTQVRWPRVVVASVTERRIKPGRFWDRGGVRTEDGADRQDQDELHEESPWYGFGIFPEPVIFPQETRDVNDPVDQFKRTQVMVNQFIANRLGRNGTL
jgi:hypothetical protein